MRLLGCILVGSCWCVGCARSSASEATATVSSAAPAVRSPSEAAPTWKVRTRYGYELKMTTRIILDQQAPLFDFDLAAMVELVPLAVEGDTVSLSLALKEARFASRVPGSQPEFDVMSASLGRPYAFVLEAGKVREVYVPNDVHPIVAGVFRTLSASLQFVKQPRARAWSAVEHDTTGQYTAEYSATSEPGFWHKRKTRYTSALLAVGQPAAVSVTPEVVVSSGDVRFAPDGHLASLDLRDELILKAAQSPLRSAVAVSLHGSQVGPAPETLPNWEAITRGARRLGADQPYQLEPSTGAIDDAKIAGLGFVEIVERLEKLEGEAKSALAGAETSDQRSAAQKAIAEKDSRLFLALGATLRKRPETIALTLKRIRQDSPARQVFIDALGSADTPGAQRALVELIAPSADTRLRTSALIALSRTPHPTEESVRALLGLVGDEQVGTQARYGLGTYCRRFREAGDTAQATKLGKFLVARLSADNSELHLVESLRALSNAGFEPALPAIVRYIDDSREPVRVEAVRALRLIESDQVDELLASTLEQDPVKAVRLAAIESMGSRAPSERLERALRASTEASDAHVRYRAIELSIRWLPKRPSLRETITRVAQNDQEPQVRKLAGAAL